MGSGSTSNLILSEQLDLKEVIEEQVEQLSFLSMEDTELQELAGTITEKLMEYTIDIPRIVLLPECELNHAFNDFNLSVWTTPKDDVMRVTQGFDVVHPITFNSAGNEKKEFPYRDTRRRKNKVHQMILTFFAKYCYPCQGFNSVDEEHRLAQILMDDPSDIR